MRHDTGRSGGYGRDDGRQPEEEHETPPAQPERRLQYRDEDDRRSGTWRRGTMGRDVEQYRSSRQSDGDSETYRDFGLNRGDGRPGVRSQHSPDFGEFVGKGPKGYRRSDDRILEDVQEALTRDGSVDASDIDVSVDGGDVTLTGTVATKQQKRDAEDCVEGVSGVNEVRNQLRVAKETNAVANQAQNQSQSKSGKQTGPR